MPSRVLQLGSSQENRIISVLIERLDTKRHLAKKGKIF